MVAYHLLILIDHYISDMNTRAAISYSLISLSIVIILLNLAIVVGSNLKEGLTRLKWKLIRQEQIETIRERERKRNVEAIRMAYGGCEQ